MKYTVRDNNVNGAFETIFQTDSKRELDNFIDFNLEHSGFVGFYEENNQMILVTDTFDIVIEN